MDPTNFKRRSGEQAQSKLSAVFLYTNTVIQNCLCTLGLYLGQSITAELKTGCLALSPVQ